MSISNEQLIADALGLLGVLSEVEGVTAEQGRIGLRALNELMADWEQDGVNLEYFEQSSFADDAPIPDHAILAVKYYLAMALAPYFRVTVSPEFTALGGKYYARLIRDAVKQRMQASDLSHLPFGSGLGGTWDITSGN